MRARITIAVGVGLVIAGVFLWIGWKHDEPRRGCVQTLRSFAQALNANDSAALLRTVVLPQAIANRTAAEQTEFIRKALQDELSSEGLNVLQKEGRFGPLDELFPREGAKWASQAGVNVTNCVAFRLDRTNGLRAEVVLSIIRNPKSATQYRVVRCNNVKQMAGP